MKSLLIGAVTALVLGLAGPAGAKDLEGAAPIVNQWTGAYFGIHGGLAQANRNGCFDLGFDILNFPVVDEPLPITSCDGPDVPDWAKFNYDQKDQGGVAGLQVGYNWQASQNFLLGVELSASATGLNGWLNTDANGDPSALGGQGIWNNIVMGTVKAGVTKDKWLLYVEGGVAAANASFLGDLGCDFNVTHTGPVAGAGIGVKLSEKVSLDLKYDHIWLSGAQASCNPFLVDPNLIHFPTQILTQGSIDVIKLGLNFRLGS